MKMHRVHQVHCYVFKFEVMMFGMTGAGKSALGNLIAGQNIFDSGTLIPRVVPFQGILLAFSLCRTILPCFPCVEIAPNCFSMWLQFDSQPRG